MSWNMDPTNMVTCGRGVPVRCLFSLEGCLKHILSRLTPDAADPQCAFIVDVVLNVVLRIRGTR